VAQAEACLDQLRFEHRNVERIYYGISCWHPWRKWGAKAEMEDLRFAIIHAAMDVVRAKAAAWETYERTRE
jgi:hypothetical protein